MQAIFAAPRHPYTALLLASHSAAFRHSEDLRSSPPSRVACPLPGRVRLRAAASPTAARAPMHAAANETPETAASAPTSLIALSSCRGDGMSDTPADLRTRRFTSSAGADRADPRVATAYRYRSRPHETLCPRRRKLGCGKSTCIQRDCRPVFRPPAAALRSWGTELCAWPPTQGPAGAGIQVTAARWCSISRHAVAQSARDRWRSDREPCWSRARTLAGASRLGTC